MQKVYEFLLWNNCSNNCSFCHQREHERRNTDKILTPIEQIESLQLCEDFLDTTFIKGNHILLVGGEIFDTINEEVQNKLKDLLSKVIDKMNKKEIDLLYINTNLTYKNIELLYWFLDLIETNILFDRLKFTTSYDILGRYSCKERELLFYHNLKAITDKYKDVHIVVNTVLTNEACKRIQKDMFGADYLVEYIKQQGKNTLTIKEWVDYFKVDINTIPYIRLDAEAAPQMPTKATVFATLLHIDTIIPGYLKQYADNIALKQEKLLYEYNKIDKKFIYCSADLNDCEHSINFTRCFADSDKCYPCEIQKLEKYKQV